MLPPSFKDIEKKKAGRTGFRPCTSNSRTLLPEMFLSSSDQVALTIEFCFRMQAFSLHFINPKSYQMKKSCLNVIAQVFALHRHLELFLPYVSFIAKCYLHAIFRLFGIHCGARWLFWWEGWCKDAQTKNTILMLCFLNSKHNIDTNRPIYIELQTCIISLYR